MFPMPAIRRWSMRSFFTAWRDPRRSPDNAIGVNSGSSGSGPSAPLYVGPARRVHEGDGAEAADVAVVQRAPVVEREGDGGVAALGVGERAVIDEQGAGEARLHDDAVAGVELERDELRAPRAADDAGAGDAAAQGARRDLAEDVGARGRRRGR